MSKTLLLILSTLPADASDRARLERAASLLDSALFDPRVDAVLEKEDPEALELRLSFAAILDDRFVSRDMLRGALANLDKDFAAVASEQVRRALDELNKDLIGRLSTLELAEKHRAERLASLPRDPDLAFVTRKELADAVAVLAARDELNARHGKSAFVASAAAADPAPALSSLPLGAPVLLRAPPFTKRAWTEKVNREVNGAVVAVEVDRSVDVKAFHRFDCSSIRIELGSGDNAIKGKIVGPVKPARHFDEKATVSVDFDQYGRTEVPVEVLELDAAALEATAKAADAATRPFDDGVGGILPLTGRGL